MAQNPITHSPPEPLVCGERFWFSSTALEKFVEQAGFLGGHAHALTIDGIEATDRIPERQ